MKAMRWMMSSPRRFGLAGRLSRLGRFAVRRGKPIVPLPPPLNGWTQSRDVPVPQGQTFRDWWLDNHGDAR
jgi:L-lactate dehydrogenase complex protein LldF